MHRVQIAVYGAGGFGREVAWLAEACSTPEATYEVICFIEDNAALLGHSINDVPVLSLVEARERFPGALIAGGVGSPRTRQTIMEKAAGTGFRFATLVHPRVERSRWVEIGEGAVICAGNILTVNIVLQRHVQINLDCTIGHDVVMGDFTTLAPGVHVSGWVHCGQRVYMGTGAVILNGTENAPLTIGNDAVIGAGAVVTRSVPPGVTVVGVPARPLQRGQG